MTRLGAAGHGVAVLGSAWQGMEHDEDTLARVAAWTLTPEDPT